LKLIWGAVLVGMGTGPKEIVGQLAARRGRMLMPAIAAASIAAAHG
jgi:hypothetical protein